MNDLKIPQRTAVELAQALDRVEAADTAFREWQAEERAKAAAHSAALEPLIRELQQLVSREVAK